MLRVDGEPAFRTRHANPYNARLYEAMQRTGATVRDLKYRHIFTSTPDIVHLHWPELTFLSGHQRWRVAARLLMFFSLLRVARLKGTRLVWTAHNVTAHEQRSTPALRKWFRRLWCANVDGVLALTEQGVGAVRSAYPELADVPIFVTPHGHYLDDYDLTLSREEARRRLGIAESRTVIAVVGQIRQYKNVPALVNAVLELADPQVLLLVAGRPDREQTAHELRDAAHGNPSVQLHLDFLSDEYLATVLRAADLVVLPYRAIQNSGSVILALSAARPVVVPDLGAMAELTAQVGNHWVHTYTGDFTAGVLRESLDWLGNRAADQQPPDLSNFDWATIAAMTTSAYQAVLSSPRSRRLRSQIPATPTGRRSPEVRTER